MTENIRLEIRLPESVSPSGPGAIVDIAGSSLVAPDMSRWSTKFADELKCARLSRQLGGGLLLSAPVVFGDVTERTPTIPFWRFPAWRFCERCGAITKSTRSLRGQYANICECRGNLVPMRFVAVCETGSHLQDIDWPTWVHRIRKGSEDLRTEEQRHCREKASLKLSRVAKAGEGLASMVVVCAACRITKSMVSLGSKSALTDDGFRCNGAQPWFLRKDAVECAAILIAKQRGATSNYLAEVVSAIDLPQGEDPELQRMEVIAEHPLIPSIRHMAGSPVVNDLIDKVVSDFDQDGIEVRASLVAKVAEMEGVVADRPIVALKEGEWFALQQKIRAGLDEEFSDFIVDGRDHALGVTEHAGLARLIDGVGQVRRLREVKALHGYRRHLPDSQKQPADIGGFSRTPSFPAIELFGEGIFIRFDAELLRSWEKRKDVEKRAQILSDRLSENVLAAQLDEPSARHVALHTFSHLLLRRLSFTSGYAAASLQERIYSSAPEGVDMSGVLIYTAAGDAQGTLGGLVRLGDKGILESIILGALSDASFCSNDPVCLESDAQGSSHLNLAACHGCSLVSETSCESRNSLLDRQLLLGGEDVEFGLFSELLAALHS